MGRLIDSLNKRMVDLLNKKEPVYEAIFGKEEYTENIPIVESSDYNCGAVVNELEFLKRYIDYVVDSFSIDTAKEELLERVIKFFIDMDRIYAEEDSELLNRFAAYMRRKGNKRWSTGWSYKDIFAHFFDSNNIYIEENYVETDLVSNGGFELATGNDFDDWTESESGSSTITKDVVDPFEDSACARFDIDASNSQAYVSQVLAGVVAGKYKLCFWGKEVNGINWTQRVSSFGSSTIYDVVHNGSGLWAAVGHAGKLATSLNGINWTQRVSSFGSSTILSVEHNSSNLWVAVGQGGKLATSTDGINWVQRTSGFGGGSYIWDVVYNGSDLWVAVGDAGELATSTDGINWTQRTSSFGSTIIRGAVHNHLSGEDGLWVAVGYTGKLATSSDGINWVQRTSSFGSTIIRGVAHNHLSGSGYIWVAVGDAGKLATSSDGINWVQRTSSFGTSNIFDVAHNGSDLWVAVGDAGELATSTDGINWTQRTSGSGSSYIIGIAHDQLGLWVATGEDGKLTTSGCPFETPVKIYVKRSGDNYYYNFEDNTWQAGVAYKSFKRSFKWEYRYGFIDNGDTRDLTIYFENDGDIGTNYAFQIDRVMFGIWQDYPSIKVLIAFAGVAGAENVGLWIGDEDNLIDRGECEETTSPMIFDETAPVLTDVLWVRDGTKKYWEDYSYKFTKDIASGDIATVDLVDNNTVTDHHGLKVDREYTFAARLYIPSGTILGSEIKLQIMDYVSSWETEEQAAALVYNAWQYVKVTKTIRTGVADNDWNSVCWSSKLNLFCAVAYIGAGNRVMTSPDGINWTIRYSAANNQWTSVCWSPKLNLFCAVAITGTNNRVMTSPDGINWTIRTSAADNEWYGICWSPELSLFCAVASSGIGNRVMTSPDGINWTIRTSAADESWKSVCWSPELSLFCAVASSGTDYRVMTSVDGATWAIKASAADNSWNSVCWSSKLNLFCAVAYSGTTDRVMTSVDGATWVLRTTPDRDLRSVCWSPELEKFCAVASSGTGDRVMTSKYGIDWDLQVSAANNIWTSVCWSPELSLFCTVAGLGTRNRVMTSPGGVHWTERISATIAGIILRIKAESTAALNELFYVDDIRVFEGSDNNMEHATFFDQDFIAGEGAGYTGDFYIELLKKARSAGVKSIVENILRVIT